MLGGWPGTARRSACPPRGGGTVTGRVLTPGGQCTSRPVRGHHPSRRRAHAERPKCQGPINIGREPPRREPCSKCQGGSERPGQSPCLLKGGPSHLLGQCPVRRHACPAWGDTDGKTGRTNMVGSCPRITGSSCHTSRYGGSAPELAALRSAVDILGLRRPPLSRSSDDEGRGCCVMGGLPHLVADQSQDRRSSADGVNRAIVLVEKVSCWVNLTRASLARSVRRREISSRYHCLPTTMFCRSALKVSISSWSEYPASSS